MAWHVGYGQGLDIGYCLWVSFVGADFVGNPACVILWVPIVIDVIVGLPGLFVLDAGELQMTCVVAIGYNAIIAAVVGVE